MVYVLVVVALLAALNFTLTRSNDTSEASVLSEEELDVMASQIIQVSNQVKQGINQMLWTGRDIDELHFDLPGSANFNTDTVDQVFHPDGGGIVLPRLSEKMLNSTSSTLDRWHLGRFSNVEWSLGTGQDIILTAFNISEEICLKINEKITGNSSIPSLTGYTREFLVDDSTTGHGGSNSDFQISSCTPQICDDYASLCVANTTNSAWAYYKIIAMQ